MQADTSPTDGGYAVIYMNKKTPVKQGDVVNNLTFLRTVTLDTPVSTTITGTIRSWFSPRLSLSFTLTPTSFNAVDMYGTINNITYTSEDGISYVRTDEYGDSYNISNLTIPSLNENLLKFIVNKSVSFNGLYKYSEVNAEYELVETQLGDIDSLDVITGKSVYGNNGIIKGTLPNYSSSSIYVSYNSETDTQLNMKLSSLSNARISNNTNIYASKSDLASSIKLVPNKIKSGEIILGVEGNYTGNVDMGYATTIISNTKVYDYDSNTQVQHDNTTGVSTPLYSFNEAGEEQICIAPYRTYSGANGTRYVYIYDKSTGKYISAGLLNLQSNIDSNIVSNSISIIGVSNVKNGKFRVCNISYNNINDVKVPYLYVYDIYFSKSTFNIDTDNMWKCELPTSCAGKSPIYFTMPVIPMFSGENNEYISFCVSYGGGFISENQRAHISIKLLDEYIENTNFKKSQVNICAITNYSAPTNASTTSILCNNRIVLIPMGSNASTTMKCQLIIMNENFAPIKVNEYSFKIIGVNKDGTKCISNDGGTYALYNMNVNYTTGNISFTKIRNITMPISSITCYCVSKDSNILTTFNNQFDGSNACTCMYINWDATDDSILSIIGTLPSMPISYATPIPDGSGVAGFFETGSTPYNRILRSTKTLVSFIYDNKTGYITDDATSTSNDLLVGTTAYSNNGKIKGSMPNNGALSYTPSVSQQTIPVGYTSGGIIEAVTNNIDSNIQPENIKEGVTILGVTGTYTGE